MKIRTLLSALSLVAVAITSPIFAGDYGCDQNNNNNKTWKCLPIHQQTPPICETVIIPKCMPVYGKISTPVCMPICEPVEKTVCSCVTCKPKPCKCEFDCRCKQTEGVTQEQPKSNQGDAVNQLQILVNFLSAKYATADPKKFVEQLNIVSELGKTIGVVIDSNPN